MAATNQEILTAVSELKGALSVLQNGASAKDIERIERQLTELTTTVGGIAAADGTDTSKIETQADATSNKLAEVDALSKKIDAKLPPIVPTIGVVAAILLLLGLQYKDIASYREKIANLSTPLAEAKQALETSTDKLDAAKTTLTQTTGNLQSASTNLQTALTTLNDSYSALSETVKTNATTTQNAASDVSKEITEAITKVDNLEKKIIRLLTSVEQASIAAAPMAVAPNNNQSTLGLLGQILGKDLPPELRLASEAQQALRIGDFATAKAKAIAAKNIENPKTSTYYVLLAQIYMAENDFEKAIGSYDAAIQFVDESRKASLLNNIGSAYFGWSQLSDDEGTVEQHLQDSVKHLKQALEIDPVNAAVNSNLIVSYNSLQDYDSALAAFQSYSGEEDANVLFANACTLALLGEAEKAIAALTRAATDSAEGRQLAFRAVFDDDFKSIRNDAQFHNLLTSRVPELNMDEIKRAWDSEASKAQKSITKP